MAEDQNRPKIIEQNDHVTLVGGKSGRKLKLEKTVDNNGVVFYQARLDWRDSESE